MSAASALIIYLGTDRTEVWPLKISQTYFQVTNTSNCSGFLTSCINCLHTYGLKLYRIIILSVWAISRYRRELSSICSTEATLPRLTPAKATRIIRSISAEIYSCGVHGPLCRPADFPVFFPKIEIACNFRTIIAIYPGYRFEVGISMMKTITAGMLPALSQKEFHRPQDANAGSGAPFASWLHWGPGWHHGP